AGRPISPRWPWRKPRAGRRRRNARCERSSGKPRRTLPPGKRKLRLHCATFGGVRTRGFIEAEGPWAVERILAGLEPGLPGFTAERSRHAAPTEGFRVAGLLLLPGGRGAGLLFQVFGEKYQHRRVGLLFMFAGEVVGSVLQFQKLDLGTRFLQLLRVPA